jgi:serine/threonine protein kinase
MTDLVPGQILGNTFEILALLGCGGMGAVYRARHVELDTLHAIKVILPELAGDPRVVSLFQEESKKLRKLRHDAIVGYEGFLRDGSGLRFLVMEYVDGPSLAKVLKLGPLDLAQLRQLRDRCWAGLEAAHAKEIIHRDISPDNIILVDGRPDLAKIIDFGIAKSSDPEATTMFRGDIAGKYAFISPEQVGANRNPVDERSDIYSLGLVLAAAARGTRLDMVGDSLADVIERRRAVPDLAGIPAEIRGEIEQMLAPDPLARPKTLAALLDPEPELEPPGPPQAAEPGRRDDRAGASPIKDDEPPRRRDEPAESARPVPAPHSNFGGWAAVVVLCALIGGGAAWFLLPSPVPPQNDPPTDGAAEHRQNPPQVSDGMSELAAALHDVPCAELGAERGAQAIVVSGFLGSAGDLDRLRGLAGPSASFDAVKIYPPPQCEAIKRLAGHRALPPLRFNQESLLYRQGGEPLVVTVANGEEGGLYLYVDYFDTSGTVVHMLPTSLRPNNRAVAGQSITLGATAKTAKPGERIYDIDPPYGPNLVTVLASSKPLFAEVRPEQEPAAAYLKELDRRRDAVAGAGYAVFDTEP